MLIIKNNSEDSYSFADGNVLVPANSDVEVDSKYFIYLYRDEVFMGNIKNDNLVLSDGVSNYVFPESETLIKYLHDSAPKEVVTQFEAKDKTLKLASISGDVDENGDAVIELLIPGTPGSSDGRFMSGGMAWFSKKHDDDRIMGVYFVDKDGLLGTPDAIIGSYTDDEVSDECKGWRVPPIGHVNAETLGFYGFAPAGFYMRIIGKSGDGAQSGKKLYINLEWGKVE